MILKCQAFLLQKKNYEKSSFFSDFRSRKKIRKVKLFFRFFALGKKNRRGGASAKAKCKSEGVPRAIMREKAVKIKSFLRVWGKLL